LARWRNRLYVIGGNAANGSYLSDVISAQFDLGTRANRVRIREVQEHQMSNQAGRDLQFANCGRFP
jgi:hypothetical protein